MRRVVVTGLGMVTPLGSGVEATWSRLLAGESGAVRVTDFRGRRPSLPDRLPHPARRRLGRDVQSRSGDGAEGAAQGRRLHHLRHGGRRRGDRRLRLDAEDRGGPANATGVLIGSGIGGIGGIVEAGITLHEKGPRRISPFFIPGRLINLASGHVSIKHGLKGPNHAVVTACSTGAHAIGDAARLIALGDADVMVAGGTESPVVPDLARRLRRLPRAVDRFQRRARRRPRVPTTRTATASSWARAPASWCSRNTSTPRRAARRSTPR